MKEDPASSSSSLSSIRLKSQDHTKQQPASPNPNPNSSFEVVEFEFGISSFEVVETRRDEMRMPNPERPVRFETDHPGVDA